MGSSTPEITNATDKEEVCEKLIRLLNEEKYRFTGKASRAVDADTSWTKKAIVSEMKLHATLKNPIFWEMSKKDGHEEEVVFLIKPYCYDYYRCIYFKFFQEQNVEKALIMSAHKDWKIYPEEKEVV